MGCGKTMQLLQVAFNYEERGHKVCVIKPSTDTKHGTKLYTRIGPERETNFCFDKKTDLFKKISEGFEPETQFSILLDKLSLPGKSLKI